MTKLQVGDLHLSYGEVPILNGVDLSLEEGEVIVLLGPSGSGKTTLLRSIAGLEAPRSGTIAIDGALVFDKVQNIEVDIEKRNLGMVFQSYALWPHRTVMENVAYGLKLRGVGAEEIRQRCSRALDDLGLLPYAARYPHQLSGGQQQRVAIARALVYNPPVLLLDEPLSNLDAKLRDEAKTWLRSLILESRLSAIVVTHDQDEAMAMADKILLLSDGRIEQEGAPADIYNNPVTLFSAEFFGANNKYDGTIVRHEDGNAVFAFAGAELTGKAVDPLEDGAAASAIIRVERLRIVDGPGPNRVPMPFITSMFAGDRWQHVLRFGDVLTRAYGETSLIGTEECWLEFPPESLWLFRASG